MDWICGPEGQALIDRAGFVSPSGLAAGIPLPPYPPLKRLGSLSGWGVGGRGVWGVFFGV